MSSITRRSLLQTLTLGSAALSFGVGRRHALAAGPNKRILFMHIPHGIPEKDGKRHDNFITGAGGRDFKFGPIMSGLEKVREHVVVLDGMELPKEGGGGCSHCIGFQQLLSGKTNPKNPNSCNESGGLSVDLYLADKLGKTWTPAIPSLNLGVHTLDITHSFLANGQKNMPEQNPQKAFDRVFGTMMGTPMTGVPSTRNKRRKLVLDSVAGDLNSFMKTLTGDTKDRAEAQLAAIENLSRAVDAAGDGTVAKCTTPTRAPSGQKFPDLVKAQGQIITAAFACGLTNIANLQLRGSQGAPDCNFAPVNSGTSWHGLSHDDMPKFILAQTTAVSAIGDIAADMAKIPEGAGSMLDNTIIFCGTDIGAGHTNSGLIYFTIGGKGLGVDTGKYMKFNRNPGMGMKQQRLIVSFLHAMGLADNFYGVDSDRTRGVVPGYQI